MLEDVRIEDTEARDLTKQLIMIPSQNPPGNVDACAAFIEKWFKENGIQAEIVRGEHVANVVARLGDAEGKKLLWNGHFDVVPAGEDWNVDPFEGAERDGFIYGRGASDMKGGLASMMLAMRELKRRNSPLKGGIEFWGIGDEETGSNNGTRYLLKLLGNGYDGAVVSEPTDFWVENAQRGLRWIEIRISGKACHAGRPHIGKNAVEFAAKVIQGVKGIRFTAFNDVFEEKLKIPSLSVTMINGGRQSNIIPETCTLTIDRRMLPGETEEQVLDEIRNALAKIDEEGFTLNAEVVNKGWDPFITDPEEPIVRGIVSAYARVLRQKAGLRGKGGCTDASHIFHAGIPVVIFGPGAANESHTANEKVSISRVARAAEIFVHSAESFLS